MLSDDQIGMITVAVCFVFSEILPFITKTDANGFIHMIVLVATQTVKTLKQNKEDTANISSVEG
jgi:predicted solute-binding protein